MRFVFWGGIAVLTVWGFFAPTHARAEQRLCAQAQEISRGDLDAKLMRFRPDALWYVEQRSRLCNAGSCTQWSNSGRFLELDADHAGKFYRYSFPEIRVAIQNGAGGDHLMGSRVVTNGQGSPAFDIGKLKKSPMVRDYVYSIPSATGLPTEEFQLTIYQVKKHGGLKFDLDDDFRQGCIEVP